VEIGKTLWNPQRPRSC